MLCVFLLLPRLVLWWVMEFDYISSGLRLNQNKAFISGLGPDAMLGWSLIFFSDLLYRAGHM